MTATYASRSLKASHCIGASHVRDNASREFSLAEQQENQQKFSKISLKIGQKKWIHRAILLESVCVVRCVILRQ